VRLLPLERLVELKLASRLDESVREKYRELWAAAREARDKEER
jgi:hypothetical protein